MMDALTLAKAIESTLDGFLGDHPSCIDCGLDVLAHAREDDASDIRITVDGREFIIAVVAV